MIRIKRKPLREIFKINSKRLREHNGSLNLTGKDAQQNKEIVSIDENQVIRFIDTITGRENCVEAIIATKNKIKALKSKTSSNKNKQEIELQYARLAELTFIKEYVCIAMESDADFDFLNKGFYINDMKYSRLLATSNQAKKSIVIYVSSDIKNELIRRIDNGRDLAKLSLAGKLEAYRGLACSSSVPVSKPNGTIVVADCITTIYEDIIEIDDSREDEPVLQEKSNYKIENNENDGYGLISPALAKRWAEELELDYIPSGFLIRNSFCKGMVFTVDFHKFAHSISDMQSNSVVDVWGDAVKDIFSVELILTQSQMKLWDSYKNYSDYERNCDFNGHSFAVNNVTPKILENEVTTNYQFIQPLEMNDTDIRDLINPTIQQFKEILDMDLNKALLFLKGTNMNDESFLKSHNDFSKALMVEPSLYQDKYVRKKINDMIKKRVDDAKTGVFNVAGNFQIVSGDPVTLMQHIFNVEKITGYLKKGECYSRYWSDRNVSKVACFRAPMTAENNIRLLKIKDIDKDDSKHNWYEYLNHVIVFNSWDSMKQALNGMDADGDQVMTTDNHILIKNIKQLKTIICLQNPSQKVRITEEELIKANKNSFGDEIGKITNRITTMFCLRSAFDDNEIEYTDLSNRILCGQNYQQNAIDKTKGIESKEMPKRWWSKYVNKIKYEDSWVTKKGDTVLVEADTAQVVQEKKYHTKIMADRKPYFMNYVYPDEMNKWKKYIDAVDRKCIRKFGLTYDELKKSTINELKNEQLLFIEEVKEHSPCILHPSIMNKICWIFEENFDKKTLKLPCGPFDHSLLKTEKKYTNSDYNKICDLVKKYKSRVKAYMQMNKFSYSDDEEKVNRKRAFKDEFIQESFKICNDSEKLCNIIVDISYETNESKSFMWDVVGSQIISNLLRRNRGVIRFPVQDCNGAIEYKGQRFNVKVQRFEPDEVNNNNED